MLAAQRHLYTVVNRIDNYNFILSVFLPLVLAIIQGIGAPWSWVRFCSYGLALIMSSGERQSLLSSIIRSGQMTDAEVTNHLEMLIHLNSGKPNMFNACGSWREDLEFVQNNFGDMRRQKDFYGTKVSSGGSTSQKKTSKPSSRPATGPSKTYSPPKETPAKTTMPQKPRSTPAQPDPRMPLLKKRAQLLSELDSATGLFNIFKRMRLKREIREVEDKLNETP